jgi:hypothetical protein
MSKTACWGTNRLDIDIAEVYCGYSSCHDMCFTKFGFHVSLEALQALVAFDFDYMHTIASELYPADNLTKHGYNRLYEEGITESMMFRAKDIMDKHKDIFWNFDSGLNPEIREICLDILKPVPYYAQYSLSPLAIQFKNLNKQQEKEKAIEWFKELIPFISMYGYVDPYVKQEEPNSPFTYIGYPSKYKLADVANRIIEMYDMANNRDHGTYNINDMTYTDMYLCLDKTAIDERERLEEKKRLEDKKIFEDAFIDFT